MHTEHEQITLENTWKPQVQTPPLPCSNELSALWIPNVSQALPWLALVFSKCLFQILYLLFSLLSYLANYLWIYLVYRGICVLRGWGVGGSECRIQRWHSEFLESGPSFYHVDHRSQTQMVRLGSLCLMSQHLLPTPSLRVLIHKCFSEKGCGEGTFEAFHV